MKTKPCIALVCVVVAGAFAGCGPSAAERAAQERARLEQEKQAQQAIQKSNEAVNEVSKELGRKPPSLDLGVSTQTAQLYLFIFLAANAVGAFFGGPLGDRFGRKYVIWFSILGALPFSLALPYAGLFGSAVLTIFIGLIISSTTSSIIVFAQELVPHRFGMISGVFFGVAFGIGGLGAAVLGRVADHTGIAFVYQVCAFLPAIGLLAVFLPKMPKTSH